MKLKTFDGFKVIENPIFQNTRHILHYSGTLEMPVTSSSQSLDEDVACWQYYHVLKYLELGSTGWTTLDVVGSKVGYCKIMLLQGQNRCKVVVKFCIELHSF